MVKFPTVFVAYTLLGYDWLCFVNMSFVVLSGLAVSWLLTRSR